MEGECEWKTFAKKMGENMNEFFVQKTNGGIFGFLGNNRKQKKPFDLDLVLLR